MKKLWLNQIIDHDASAKAGELRYFYRVVRVVNDIEPKLGEDLPVEEVARYCNDDRWTVTVSNDGAA